MRRVPEGQNYAHRSKVVHQRRADTLSLVLVNDSESHLSLPRLDDDVTPAADDPLMLLMNLKVSLSMCANPERNVHSNSLAFEAALRREGRRVYIILSAFWRPLVFESPPIGDGGLWRRRGIDTALESPQNIVPWPTRPLCPGATYRAAARSVIMLFNDIGRGGNFSIGS